MEIEQGIKNLSQASLVEMAANELAARIEPRFGAMVEAVLDRNIYVSVNRAAGMLDIPASKVRRLFEERIVDFGARQQRIPVSAIKEIATSLSANRSKRISVEGEEIKVEL